jgi:hypothetical protein
MRKILENGFLEIAECPVAKSGSFLYHTSELGMDGDKMVSVRIPEEVLQQATFDFDLPITLGHTWLGLNAKGNKRTTLVGQVFDTYLSGDGMICGLVKIYDKDVIKGIMDGTMTDELSPAFRFRIVEDIDGNDDFVAEEVYAPNHIALVSKGRMGKDVRVIHQAIQEEIKGEEITVKEEEVKVEETQVPEKTEIEKVVENIEQEEIKQEETTVEEEKQVEQKTEEPVKEEEKQETPVEDPKQEETKQEEVKEETKQEEVIVPEKQDDVAEEKEEPAKQSNTYNGIMYSVMGRNGKTPLPHFEKSAKIRY